MGVNFARKSCQMPSHASVVSDKYWAGGYMSERAYQAHPNSFPKKVQWTVTPHSRMSPDLRD
jgi:hypothetical protein